MLNCDFHIHANCAANWLSMNCKQQMRAVNHLKPKGSFGCISDYSRWTSCYVSQQFKISWKSWSYFLSKTDSFEALISTLRKFVDKLEQSKRIKTASVKALTFLLLLFEWILELGGTCLQPVHTNTSKKTISPNCVIYNLR